MTQVLPIRYKKIKKTPTISKFLCSLCKLFKIKNLPFLEVTAEEHFTMKLAFFKLLLSFYCRELFFPSAQQDRIAQILFVPGYPPAAFADKFRVSYEMGVLIGILLMQTGPV